MPRKIYDDDELLAFSKFERIAAVLVLIVLVIVLGALGIGLWNLIEWYFDVDLLGFLDP